MENFKRGISSGIPIGLGYLSVSFTFGMMAVSAGLTWWEALLISMLTVTSAGQFAGLGMMILPGQSIAMLISQFTINIRYCFMSVALSQNLEPKFKGVYRWLLGFFMTDEIFAVACGERQVTRSFFAGLAVMPYLGWSGGTLFGALVGAILPDSLISALSLAIYGMFIAIVVPDLRTNRKIILVVAIAAGLSCLFYFVPALQNISSGLTISISAIAAAVVGAALFPVKIDDEEVAA